MKSTKKIYLFLILLFGLIGCQSNQQEANTIRVGTISGPETKLMEVAKQVALKQYGLNIKIIEFNDYLIADTALNDGSLEANMVQHQPFLDAIIKAKKYSLISIGKTFIYPVGIYSSKIKNLAELSDKAIVAIPNDPSNEARALLLLAKAGLITLKSGITVNATPNDVINNPKNIQFKELDVANLPRALPDVALAVINTNYAIPAGLYPSKNALYVEDAHSLYANIVVTRTADIDNPKLKQLVKALHSPEVAQAAKELFQGEAIPAW